MQRIVKRFELLATGITAILIMSYSIVIAGDNVVVIPLGSTGSKSWVDGTGQVTTTASVGIGTTSPDAKLDVTGGIKIANVSSTCDSSKAGLIRWSGSVFEGCDGNDWYVLAGVPTVVSAGQVWMDRNLGAERVAKNVFDSKSMGDLYQWGRPADGHESRTSRTVAAQSAEIVPEYGKFIIGFTDWLISLNNNLWQKSGVNNPCPAGFRLPTEEEWEIERGSWDSNDPAGAFSSPLKLVISGLRDGGGGSVYDDLGDNGNYWSSSVDGTNALYLCPGANGGAAMAPAARSMGLTIRCIKD